MKILFFVRLFYPHVGGVDRHVLKISKCLIKKGHEVTVVTENFNHLSKEEKIEGIKVVRINAGRDDWFKKFRVWKQLWQHRSIIKNSDIIHCHDVFFWYLPFRFLYFNKPVYTTFHGYETTFPPSKKAILIRKLSEKLSWGNICVGEFIKRWYGTKPTFLTYGAVDIKKTQSAILRLRSGQELKAQNHSLKLKICFVGRLEEDNGINIYFETLGELKRRGIKFEILFFGDGRYRKEAEKYGKVKVLTSEKEYFQILNTSDIVFASSYLAMLEAMAAKKPIFSIYENELKKDYLKMTPFSKWITIENDFNDFNKIIKSFLRNMKIFYDNTNKAYDWVKTQTWEELTDLYLKLWKNNDK